MGKMANVLAATYHPTSSPSRSCLLSCRRRRYDCIVRVDDLRLLSDARTQFVMYRGKAETLAIRAVCGSTCTIIHLRRDECSRAELTGSRMLTYIADRLDHRYINVNRHTPIESTVLSCFGIRDRTDRSIIGVLIGTSDYVRITDPLNMTRVMSVDASMSIAIMNFNTLQSRTIEYAGANNNWPVVDQSLRRVFKNQKWTVLLVLAEKMIASVASYTVLYGMTDDPTLHKFTENLPRPITDVLGAVTGHCLTQHVAKNARRFDILSRDTPTMQCTVYDVLQTDASINWKILHMSTCTTSVEEHIKVWLSSVVN